MSHGMLDLVGMAILAIIAYTIVIIFSLLKRKMLCVDCKAISRPQSYAKGVGFFIEIILWIFFVVPGLLIFTALTPFTAWPLIPFIAPGLIYTVWRLTTTGNVCPDCHGKMISLDSPKASKILHE